MRQLLFELLGGTHRVLVVAGKSDLVGALSRSSFSVSHADTADAISVFARSSLDLICVDGAAWSAETWAAARDAAELAHVPVLVVEPEGPIDPERDVACEYSAIDTVARPIRTAELDRRMHVLAEMGRHRRLADIAGVAIDASISAVMIIDAARADLPVLYVNPVFEHLTGYSRTEVLGKPSSILEGPDTDQETVAELAESLRNGRPVDARMLHHRKDGSTFWNEMAIRPAHDEGGQLRYFIAVLHEANASEQQATPAAERIHSPLFLDLVLEEMPAGVLTADRHQRVTFINRGGITVLDLQDQNYLGKPMGEVMRIPPEITVSPQGEPQRFEYTIRRPNDAETEIGVAITSVRGLHPDLKWFILFRDLTSVRETELAARRVERLAAMGTMVAGFAHEVRNPVSAMRSLIELLDEETPASDPRRATMTRLQWHIDRIERLVKTSLRFGHPEEPRREWIAPGKIADNALDELHVRTRNLGSIRRYVGTEVPNILVDEKQIVQALVALLNNALDAVGYADQVELHVDGYSTSAGERGVRFEVRDFGPGISEHILGRIFDPFFTTKASGTGLGLSIAQRLVHDNGGRLEVSTVKGGGATFVIELLQPRGSQRQMMG